MKTGDRFISFNALQNAMQQCWDVKFPFMKSFIHHLPQHLDVSCAKHVFYNENFLKETKETIPWNEFKGISKAKTQTYWKDDQWIISPDTSIVHEIRNPKESFFPEKDHPSSVIKKEPVKRLIIGQFKEFSGYVFLGLYKLDQVTSFSYDNTTAYEVDGASFPCNPTKGFTKPLITYPHCVWKRIEDVLDKSFKE